MAIMNNSFNVFSKKNCYEIIIKYVSVVSYFILDTQLSTLPISFLPLSKLNDEGDKTLMASQDEKRI